MSNHTEGKKKKVFLKFSNCFLQVFSPMTFKLTFEILVGAFLKSTRHL